MGLAVQGPQSDPADIVGRVAAARRDRLLRAYRQRLRPEDLEDCFSQATLELVVRARRAPFNSAEHVKNALEQKFASRINDRRRALAGRSGIEAALANALSVSDSESNQVVEDRRAAVEQQVQAHAELRRLREVIGELTNDQRLVLHGEINLDLDAQEFCARYGWTADKFRKVGQRARHKLRLLVDEYHRGARCERLEPDLLALAARNATDEQTRRARIHIENCPTCARFVAAVNHASRSRPALFVAPALAVAGVIRSGWLVGVRRLVNVLRPRAAQSGIAGATGVTGTSAVGLVGAKAGVLALCVAGAVGTYAICTQHHRVVARRPARGLALIHGAEVSKTHSLGVSLARASSSSTGRPKLSRIGQIEREFGRRGAHRASQASDARTGTSSTQTLGTQSRPVVGQEVAEFGFER